jgi:hypothetical protein
MWGCRTHWYALSQHLRDRIWRAYRPGQEIDQRPSADYLAVAREVQAWIKAQEASPLFGSLPVHPPALPADELQLLESLPGWDTVAEIDQADEAVARRLERRGLIRIERAKDDPIASRPTMYAGKLPAARGDS